MLEEKLKSSAENKSEPMQGIMGHTRMFASKTTRQAGMWIE